MGWLGSTLSSSIGGKVDGLFYAFGFCGHGFQLGPGVGDVMAELISTGQTHTHITPFDVRRFSESPTSSPIELLNVLPSQPITSTVL